MRDVTAHAEMQAITAAADFLNGKYLIGCTLYVTLEPCLCAQEHCPGVNWIEWSLRLPIQKRGFLQAGVSIHPKTKIQSGLLANEAKALLDIFFTTSVNEKKHSN